MEIVPCPCCTKPLKVIGSRKRKILSESGESKILVIRRLRCTGCHKIHHELPDCILPYKRYESSCVEQVIAVPDSAVAADDSTLYRWRTWFQNVSRYMLGCLVSILYRFQQESAKDLSIPLPSTHPTIGHYVGDAAGWLARAVRPIANLNLWVQTRSAFLSADI